jgi:hypothetical protein
MQKFANVLTDSSKLKDALCLTLIFAHHWKMHLGLEIVRQGRPSNPCYKQSGRQRPTNKFRSLILHKFGLIHRDFKFVGIFNTIDKR